MGSGITLILDTSTSKAFFGIASGEELLFHEYLPDATPCSHGLMGKIERAFSALGLKSKDLTAIAVARGPGSYTGMRVGLAAAKGMAFPRALPLIGFCTLEGFISHTEGPFASVIDLRLGGSYVLLQNRSGNTIEFLSEPQWVSSDQLPHYLVHFPHRVGPATSYPDPHHVTRLAAKKYQEGLYTPDLEPLYLRTPNYQKSPFLV